MSAIPLRRIEGKYEILEKLGEGGMGAVYKVRHRLLDDVRVIKMMRPQLVADEEFKARFQREARVAIQLRHPNIAHLIDFTIDEEDGTAFIVMEFIDGMTLEEVLRHSGPPSLGLALEIGQQSLRALGCLHERGFVHRDVSPDNLMLTADAEGRPLVKLIDLGIAKVLGAGGGTDRGHLTGTGIFLGKVRYSSPEQFGAEGAAMVDARGDLYSFGVVLYELLTGRYPIQGKDPSSLIGGHLFRPPLDFAESDPDGRVPPELRALILRALAKEPAQRFATSRELGAALGRLRVAGDLGDGDLKRALTRLPSGTVRVPLPPPGSTQDRLNAQFGLHTTPSSHGSGEGGKALPPPPRRSPEIELRVRTLLREAEALLERNDFEGALAHLERGKALAPGNAEVQALLAKAEAAVRERRRTRDFTGVQEEIEAALARHDYRAAERRLYQAEASFGEQEVFSRLHERLGELRRADLEARRRAERQAEIEAEEAVRRAEIEAEEAARQAEMEAKEAARQVEEAARLAEIEAQEAARQAEIEAQETARQAELAKAAAVEAEAVRRREEAEQAAVEAAVEVERRRREKEAERAEQLAAAVAAVDACLDAGDPEGAARLLPGFVALFGDAPVLRERWERVEELRRRQTRERADLLLAEARELQAGGELEAALGSLREAGRLNPDDPEARSLAAEVEAAIRRRDEESRQRREFETALAAIDEGLERGDLAGAARLLPAAVARFGGAPALRERWERLEALQRKARVEALRGEADSLARTGHVERAIRKLRQALELDPDDRRIAERLAELTQQG